MDLPKSAHAILADAVAKVLDPPLIDQTPTYVAELEMALHNYRLASNTALETSFGRIIRGAILAIDNGAPQDAKRYLSTLLLANDFVPVVDVNNIEPRAGPVATISLTAAESASSMSRVKWAEGLILQLPEAHDGRNSWLLNYGIGEAAIALREGRGCGFDAVTQAATMGNTVVEVVEGGADAG
jgi:hypothetical protein